MSKKTKKQMQSLKIMKTILITYKFLMLFFNKICGCIFPKCRYKTQRD